MIFSFILIISFTGIEKNLNSLNYNFFNETDKILVDVSWDGVALYGASSRELWPITCTFVNERVPPFLIGCFIGNSKPKNPGEYFYLMLEEIKTLRVEGVLVGRDQIYKQFDVRLYKADTPARQWAKGSLCHGGYESCDYCNQKCVRINNHMVYSDVVCTLRTNDSFRNREDGRHNK